MCYFCPLEATADAILTHTLLCHNEVGKTLSIRKRQLDEKLGTTVFRSLHFSWLISTLKSYEEQGTILQINTEEKKITFKRKQVDTHTQECNKRSGSTETRLNDESSQTTLLDTDLCNLLQDAASVLKERGRYEDFLSVLRCIADSTLIDNIALHLILDVGNFYSTNCIQGLRYSEETITFWVTVKKLFKGKGINFLRGFKAQGLEKDKEYISPKDCRIHFAVPSNPTLASESTKYTVGLENPGILDTSLDAFAEKNADKDVKISIDGKKLALGFGKTGDENLGGFENSPTLKERQERLATEQKTARHTKDHFENETLDRDKAKQGLLLTISYMSKRIHELREFNVKRKRHVENLMKCVDGNWQQSKFAHAISYWQTKLVQANNCVLELLDGIDKLGYAVSCLNGTSKSYIQGSKSTVWLNKQENYKCLKDGIELDGPLYRDSNIIKQRSNAWHQLRNGSRVTGSTIFRAIGLDTLKEQQNHYDKVYKGVEQPISDHLSSLFEYGTAQEINALGSFVGKIMPVYFPDLLYKEDGCITLPFGDTRAVINADGTGVNTNNDVVAFEFKCPMPGKKYKTDALYEIPVYYTTQVLSQMAAKNLQELVTHQTVSHTSVDISMLNFGQESEHLSKNAMEVRMQRDQLEGILKFTLY